MDRAAESERAEARIRARKVAIWVGVVLLIAGLLGVGIAFLAKMNRLAEYTEHARTVRADIVALRRGAQSDAELILRAFDDKEVKRLLHDQADEWTSRVQNCEQLGLQVDELVPQNPEQAADETSIARDLAMITSASKALAVASQSQDVFAARVAASQLASADRSK